MSQVLSVRISPDIKSQLESLAQKMGKTSYELVKEYLTMLALINKAKDSMEATLKFIDLITDMFPEMYREIEIAIDDVCRETAVHLVDRCYVYTVFRKSPSEKYFRLEIIAKYAVYPQDSLLTIVIDKQFNKYYISRPPTKKEVDIIIETLKALVS